MCKPDPKGQSATLFCRMPLCHQVDSHHICLCLLSLSPGLPDPFAKIVVDGSGQCHSTDTVKNTLDPKWNQHYDL